MEYVYAAMLLHSAEKNIDEDAVSAVLTAAGVDADGNLIAWKHSIIGDGRRLLSSGAKTPYYDIPNQHIEIIGLNHGVRLKHWRAVGHGFTKFAIESFIDEIAVSEGVDPYQFHRQVMRNSPRA